MSNKVGLLAFDNTKKDLLKTQSKDTGESLNIDVGKILLTVEIAAAL